MMSSRQISGSLIVAMVLGLATTVSVSGQSTQVVDGVVNAGEYKIEHVDGPVHHTHHDWEAKGVRAHAMTRTGSSMTVELALDRTAFPEASGTTLDVIYAVGHYDSFTIYHAFRGATRLEL